MQDEAQRHMQTMQQDGAHAPKCNHGGGITTLAEVEVLAEYDEAWVLLGRGGFVHLTRQLQVHNGAFGDWQYDQGNQLKIGQLSF